MTENAAYAEVVVTGVQQTGVPKTGVHVPGVDSTGVSQANANSVGPDQATANMDLLYGERTREGMRPRKPRQYGHLHVNVLDAETNNMSTTQAVDIDGSVFIGVHEPSPNTTTDPDMFATPSTR